MTNRTDKYNTIIEEFTKRVKLNNDYIVNYGGKTIARSIQPYTETDTPPHDQWIAMVAELKSVLKDLDCI